MAHEGAGRPTDLDEELFAKIKESVLEGCNLKEIAEQSEIPESTLYTWHSKNYLNIADKIEGWKRDRKLRLAERNIEDMLELDTTNLVSNSRGEIYETKDTGLVRVKADMSKFVAETLGKDNYSKRSELSGKNGAEIVVQVVNYANNTPAQLPATDVPTTPTPST